MEEQPDKPTTDAEVLKRAQDEEAWSTQQQKEAKDKAEKVRLLLKDIASSKVEGKDFFAEVRSAWREYQSESSEGKYRIQKFWYLDSYNRYWADTMTMLPSVYSSPPKTVARRRFEKDPVAKTACILVERLSTFLLDSQPINRVYTTCALEYLNASRATGRLFYTHEIIKRKKRVEVMEVIPEEIPLSEDPNAPPPPAPEPMYILASGKEAPLDVTIMSDGGGDLYYEEDDEEKIVNPKIMFRPVHFDQMLISTGARDYTDIWRIDYQITTTRKAAYEKFGDVVKKINEAVADDRGQLEDHNDAKPSEELFTYWESWNYSTKKVYFVHEDYPIDFLKVEDDLYGLRGFYPSPMPMMANERYDNCYPTPDYTMTRDVYEQLHLLAKRINRVTKAIKGVLIYDGDNEDLDALFTELIDNEGVAVAGFKDMMGAGGLDALIQAPPYERLANVLQILIQVFEKQKADLDELRGISDIIRGQSDPVTSATAEKIKKQTASNRQSVRQKEMVRFVRDSVEMMCDLALKVFPYEYLQKIMGFNHLDDPDKKRFDEALLMLKDDETRLVRIDIETDSITAVDDEEDKQAANEMMTAISGYIRETVAAIEQSPSVAPVMFKLLELALSSFKFGKHAQDELNEMFAQITEKMQMPKEPPPPDPKLLQIESNERIKSQEMAMKSEKDVAMFQADQAEKQRQFELKMAEMSQRAQEAQQASFDRQQAMQVQIQELTIRVQEMLTDAAIRREKNAQDGAYWAAETETERQGNLLRAQTEATKTEADMQKHVDNLEVGLQKDGTEKELEAIKEAGVRHDKEADRALEEVRVRLEGIATASAQEERTREEDRLEKELEIEAISALKPEAPEAPKISISLDAKEKPKPKKDK